jgi:hypothetical protein
MFGQCSQSPGPVIRSDAMPTNYRLETSCLFIHLAFSEIGRILDQRLGVWFWSKRPKPLPSGRRLAPPPDSALV